MKEQLTLEMLCCYLPYGLKIQIGSIEEGYCLEMTVEDEMESGYISLTDVIESKAQPIFRNLKTDLTLEIEHNGERFIPLQKLFETAYPMAFVKKKEWEISVSENNFATIKSKQNYISFQVDLEDAEMVVFNNDGEDMEQINDRYKLYQLLHSWHFWIYDQSYFEKKIILDISELNK